MNDVEKRATVRQILQEFANNLNRSDFFLDMEITATTERILALDRPGVTDGVVNVDKLHQIPDAGS